MGTMKDTSLRLATPHVLRALKGRYPLRAAERLYTAARCAAGGTIAACWESLGVERGVLVQPSIYGTDKPAPNAGTPWRSGTRNWSSVHAPTIQTGLSPADPKIGEN